MIDDGSEKVSNLYEVEIPVHDSWCYSLDGNLAMSVSVDDYEPEFIQLFLCNGGYLTKGEAIKLIEALQGALEVVIQR